MEYEAERWRWKLVYRIHADSACSGTIYSYINRFYQPQDSSYHRCIGRSWCSDCREYSSNMVYVAATTQLWDATAALPPHEREHIMRGGHRLLDFLDRLVRRGQWPLETSD